LRPEEYSTISGQCTTPATLYIRTWPRGTHSICSLGLEKVPSPIHLSKVTVRPPMTRCDNCSLQLKSTPFWAEAALAINWDGRMLFCRNAQRVNKNERYVWFPSPLNTIPPARQPGRLCKNHASVPKILQHQTRSDLSSSLTDLILLL
jgi:hypothetical protein